MTLFSFEVPLAHLKDFDQYQDFTFALCYLMYASQDYTDYVDDRCYRKDIVHIDNSFNETNVPIAPQEMARIYNKYKPTTVLSPDADWWTSDDILTAFDDLASKIPHRHIMGIYRNDAEYYSLQARSCNHLATSYWWRNKTVLTPNVHFLGLGNLNDVVSVKPVTLDTSQPIKMALRGESLAEWAAAGGVYTRHYTREAWGPARSMRAWEYFTTVLTDKQLALAVQNVVDLKALVNGAGNKVDPLVSVPKGADSETHNPVH